MSTQSGEIFYSVVSVGSSPEEQQMFESNVKFALDDAIAPPPTNLDGFNSFATADMLAVSNYLWAFKTALTPGWQGENLSLLEALKIARGKGPSVCIVFLNGDSACYQLNPLDKNAARYISGTAADIAGHTLSGEPGSGGVGDGEPVDVVRTSTNEYRWTNGPTATLWLFCATSGGQVLSCYYIAIPDR